MARLETRRASAEVSRAHDHWGPLAGGIWSFIIGAQVACTLLFVPAAVGIFSSTFHDQLRRTAFPTERYLTFRLTMDDEVLAGERGVPDDGQIGVRRARAYEELAGRLRQEFLMAAVGVIACAAPARRALRVQPTDALRQS